MRVNGHETDRLPNTLNISFAHIHANTLLSEIGDRVAASAGMIYSFIHLFILFLLLYFPLF